MSRGNHQEVEVDISKNFGTWRRLYERLGWCKEVYARAVWSHVGLDWEAITDIEKTGILLRQTGRDLFTAGLQKASLSSLQPHLQRTRWPPVACSLFCSTLHKDQVRVFLIHLTLLLLQTFIVIQVQGHSSA